MLPSTDICLSPSCASETVQRERCAWLTSKLIDRVVDEVEEAPYIDATSAAAQVAAYLPPNCCLQSAHTDEEGRL